LCLPTNFCFATFFSELVLSRPSPPWESATCDFPCLAVAVMEETPHPVVLFLLTRGLPLFHAPPSPPSSPVKLVVPARFDSHASDPVRGAFTLLGEPTRALLCVFVFSVAGACFSPPGVFHRWHYSFMSTCELSSLLTRVLLRIVSPRSESPEKALFFFDRALFP